MRRRGGGSFFPGDAEHDPDPLFHTTSAPTRRMRIKDDHSPPKRSS